MKNLFTGLQQIIYGNIKIMLIMLTPELAKALLQDEKRMRNRGMRREVINLYAQQMPDEWRINGSSIVVDSEGHLVDGQHRCAACIQAGVPVPVILVSGVEAEEVFDTIDTGKKRTAADVLGSKGYRSPGTLSAVTRLLISIKENKFSPNSSTAWITNHKVENFVQSNPDLVEHILFCKRLQINHRGIASVPSTAAFSYLIREWDAHANHFIECLYTGANLESGNPILVLRNRLISMNAQRLSNRTSVGAYQLITALIHSWNIWGAGSELKKFQWPKTMARINAPKIPAPGEDRRQPEQLSIVH